MLWSAPVTRHWEDTMKRKALMLATLMTLLCAATTAQAGSYLCWERGTCNQLP